VRQSIHLGIRAGEFPVVQEAAVEVASNERPLDSNAAAIAKRGDSANPQSRWRDSQTVDVL
jgi:hypothetical protein